MMMMMVVKGMIRKMHTQRRTIMVVKTYIKRRKNYADASFLSYKQFDVKAGTDILNRQAHEPLCFTAEKAKFELNIVNAGV